MGRARPRYMERKQLSPGAPHVPGTSGGVSRLRMRRGLVMVHGVLLRPIEIVMNLAER